MVWNGSVRYKVQYRGSVRYGVCYGGLVLYGVRFGWDRSAVRGEGQYGTKYRTRAWCGTGISTVRRFGTVRRSVELGLRYGRPVRYGAVTPQHIVMSLRRYDVDMLLSCVLMSVVTMVYDILAMITLFSPVLSWKVPRARKNDTENQSQQVPGMLTTVQPPGTAKKANRAKAAAIVRIPSTRNRFVKRLTVHGMYHAIVI